MEVRIDVGGDVCRKKSNDDDDGGATLIDPSYGTRSLYGHSITELPEVDSGILGYGVIEEVKMEMEDVDGGVKTQGSGGGDVDEGHNQTQIW
ncbi:hypothetical protein L6452_05438 [Arctium lappa]|uniref:Uncharacterized protein n=1 Tax=Arctium lappa TaxID=4217 RepID=A0ACB9EG18_ARCLA|nr:hypothetical protein L6452_05438 [Arctium lappa]